jgi:hypothetical protein
MDDAVDVGTMLAVGRIQNNGAECLDLTRAVNAAERSHHHARLGPKQVLEPSAGLGMHVAIASR